MRVLAVVQHPVAGVGVFGPEIAESGHRLEAWVPADGPPPRPLSHYDAVIALGGGMQADEEDRFPWLATVRELLQEAIDVRMPTLGVCLGGQVLARAAGGAVGPSPEAEWGWRRVELTEAARADPLLGPLSPEAEVFQWHSYAFSLPPGATPLAQSPVCLQAFRVGPLAWGLQWHPEVTAESIALWAERYPPAPGGVPVQVDREALAAQVAARIARTNAEGRALCARFIALAGQ
ncbi:MAG TPA: type 1 glutamine amidotransferase [Solirubrobacteraceae bacterium]|nr:type 1 glutamine amidotransferase [Solirubrobacteraceae bacterium]